MLLLFIQIISVFSWERISSDSFYDFYNEQLYPDILDDDVGSKDEFSDPTVSERETFKQV